MKSAFPGFSPEALVFLRQLTRNNRREWFQPRKAEYESLIKAPMLELVAALNDHLARFAPDYVTPPEKSIYRIHRDTRFSPDKTPYKNHIAATFPRKTSGKRRGAVFHLYFSPSKLVVFGGVFLPDRDELLAYRAYIAENHREFDKIVRNKKLRRMMGEIQGEQLSRMPKGFAPDHLAEALLRHRRWYLRAILESKLLTTPLLAAELGRHFEAVAPFVEFLNRPLAGNRQSKSKKIMFRDF